MIKDTLLTTNTLPAKDNLEAPVPSTAELKQHGTVLARLRWSSSKQTFIIRVLLNRLKSEVAPRGLIPLVEDESSQGIPTTKPIPTTRPIPTDQTFQDIIPKTKKYRSLPQTNNPTVPFDHAEIYSPPINHSTLYPNRLALALSGRVSVFPIKSLPDVDRRWTNRSDDRTSSAITPMSFNMPKLRKEFTHA